MTVGEIIPVSYAEILRAGIPALRGLGFSFSTAERGVHSLVAAQAASGLALAFLRIAAAKPLAVPGGFERRPGAAPHATRLDARGKSLLETAPFALDLVTAYGTRDGRAALLVENWFGAIFVADIALRARRSGLNLAVFYHEERADDLAPFQGSGMVWIEHARITGGGAPHRVLLDVASRYSAAAPLLDAMAVPSPSRLLLVADKAPLRHGVSHPLAGAAWQEAEVWPASLQQAIDQHFN